MLIIRNTVTSGTSAGLATVTGVQAGILGHTILAVLGLSVLIVSIPALFKAVAVAGALYLGWLGIQSFRFHAIGIDAAPAPATHFQSARDAMMTNLLNPKVIMLFFALMPGFVDPGRGQVPVQLILLAATLLLVNVAWQVPVALLARAIRPWLARPSVQRGVSRATGGVLLFFAVALFWEHAL